MQRTAYIKQSTFRHRLWLERLSCTAAFAGLLIAVFIGFHPATRENAGSDLKTLYASSWCFARGIDAYSFPEIANVFHLNGVVEPRSWYGHSPVYPPFTLAFLAPLTLLPMVVAIRVWIVLSAICLAGATVSLLHAARRVFHLQFPWTLLIVGLIAGSPIVSLGLELANVSVVSVALCIFAVATSKDSSTWLRASALVIALLLKPHIAFWVVLSLFFSRVAADRKTLMRTAIVGVAAACVMVVWSFFQPMMFQFAGYRAMVLSELAGGSMSPGNRDLMELPVQMTSLTTLLGYWLARSAVLPILSACILMAIAGGLAWTCRRLRTDLEDTLFTITAAWCAFGLIATYHRDADGTILLFVLPLLLSHLRHSLQDWWAWATLAMLLAGSFGPSLESLHWLAAQTGVYRNLESLWLRQASLAMLGLTLLLLWRLAFASRTQEATNASRSRALQAQEQMQTS